MWTLLRSRRLSGFKFRRQHFIPPFIIDFCSVQGRLVVELDGGQHLEEAAEDRRRTERLGAKDFRVIRFWNDAVLKEPAIVLDSILSCLRSGVPSSAPSGHLLPLEREKVRPA